MTLNVKYFFWYLQIKDIFDRFSKKINGTLEPNLTLYVYSAHSTTIKSLFDGLGLSSVCKLKDATYKWKNFEKISSISFVSWLNSFHSPNMVAVSIGSFIKRQKIDIMCNCFIGNRMRNFQGHYLYPVAVKYTH